jgi:UDP-N-acetylmuramyl pentapeptide phosphotransferase/UDP-N-acetylglucosamine-1-phosphate transferase
VDYLSIEFAGIPALFISFIATVVLSRIGIPIIRAKKMGQPIRDDGPESHHAKSGVPTMGGILMVIPVLLIALVFGGDRSGWLVLLGMLFLGAVGFIDDYEKLTKIPPTVWRAPGCKKDTRCISHWMKVNDYSHKSIRQKTTSSAHATMQ